MHLGGFWCDSFVADFVCYFRTQSQITNILTAEFVDQFVA